MKPMGMPAHQGANECFFCGDAITDGVSLEHIFGNAFLAYLGLKREKVTLSLPKQTDYSKVKVPSHKSCNNHGGSEFEEYLLSLIRTMDTNLSHLGSVHSTAGDPLTEALRQAFTQWLAKLYFGLVYWESRLRNHARPSYQEWLRTLLSAAEFEYLRRCFKERLAFKLPSSLFHFRLPDPPEPAFRFDFGNGLPHGLFYIRFGKHLLVTALGDGNLVHEWFGEEQVRNTQHVIDTESGRDPIAYLHAISHIWAVRELLPIEPRLEFEHWCIRDRSREGYDDRPSIDSNAVNARAEEIFQEHALKWR